MKYLEVGKVLRETIITCYEWDACFQPNSYKILYFSDRASTYNSGR